MSQDPALPAFRGSATLLVAGEAVVSVGDNTRQIVASVSKQFIGATVLLADAAGTLRVSDPVVRHVPELGPHYQDVTLHHLLTHTAGVPHWTTEIPGLWISDTLTADERIAVLARTPLLSAPGQHWHYSSIGYALLVSALEGATGRCYNELFHEWLARPAGLTATTVGPPADVPIATGHCGGVPISTDDLASTAGTGYVWSTAEDLARWTYRLHQELLPVSHHASLVARQVRPADSQQHVADAYGYGLFVGELGSRRAWFHPGDNPGFSAFAGYVPDAEMSFGFTSPEQDTDVMDLANRIIRAVVP